jgi:hypothetical protein
LSHFLTNARWLVPVTVAAVSLTSAAGDIGAVAGFETSYTVVQVKGGTPNSTPCELGVFNPAGQREKTESRWSCRGRMETQAQTCLQKAVEELDNALTSPKTAEINQALRLCRWREVDRRKGFRIHVAFKDLRQVESVNSTKSLSFNPNVLDSLDLIVSITSQGCQILTAEEIIRHLQANFDSTLKNYLEPPPSECASADPNKIEGRMPASR